MTDDAARLIVFPAEVAIEGLRLPDGLIITTELINPPTVHVVAYRCGDEIKLISRHTDEEAAKAACAALADQLHRIGKDIDLDSINPANLIRDDGGGKPN